MDRETAIKILREQHDKALFSVRTALETLIPELSESDMLRTIIRGFENWKSNGMLTFNNTNIDDILAYLEKQKEPHYTKRNALFDECVENCDPKTVEEVNKRVDDIMNMPELSAFEQALTNFIGYWEDDEERWLSQFVKKHGKHILDMAREELQKEPKSTEWIEDERIRKWLISYIRKCVFNEGEYPIALDAIAWLEKHKDLFKSGTGLYYYDGNKTTYLGYPTTEDNPYDFAMSQQKEQKPVEWGEEDEEIFNNIIEKAKGGHWIEVNEITWLINRFKSLRPKSKDELKGKGLDAEIKKYTENLYHETFGNGQGTLDEFDWEDISTVIEDTARHFYSLRPSWKPSEEHLSALLAIFNDPNNIGSQTCQLVLTDLYEQLKAL